MGRKLKKFLLCCSLCYTSLIASGQHRGTAGPPDKALDSLKKADNLSEWIYVRLDYVYPEPRKRMEFLLQTQQKAWRKPLRTEEKTAWILMLSSQGYYELQNGNILASIEHYEEALSYFEKNNIPGFEAEEYIFKPLSNNYTRLGDYKKGIYLQQQTLRYAIQTRDTPLVIATRGNLAIAFRSNGNYKEALKQISEGLAMTSADAEAGIALRNVHADILFDQGELTMAEKVLKSNIKIQEKHAVTKRTAYSLFGSYNTLGEIYFKKREFGSAESATMKALKLLSTYFPGERQREKANNSNQLGRIALEENDPRKAISYFNTSLAIFGILDKNKVPDPAKFYGDNKIVDALYSKGLALLRLNNHEQALEHIRFALEASDKIRLEIGDVKTRQQFQANAKEMAEKAIDIAYRLYTANKNPGYARIILSVAEQSKARTLLDAVRKNREFAGINRKDTLFIKKSNLERAIIFNDRQRFINDHGKAGEEKNNALLYRLSLIDKELNKRYPSAVSEDDPAMKHTMALIKKMPVSHLVVEYFSGENSIYAIAISNGDIHIYRIRDAKSINSLVGNYVKTYFSNGPDAMLNDPRKFYAASFQLYRKILPPLGKNKVITIIPDGVLGFLPFEGLPVEPNYVPAFSDWPYLLKQRLVSYAFSLKTLLNAPGNSSGSSFNGYFIADQATGGKDLPAVEQEAKWLKRLVNGNFFFDKNADSKSLFQSLNNAKILHLSTHAWLSGPDAEPTLAMADRNIYLFELTAPQQPPALVVLSACQTADGKFQNGEGILSFSRGFAAIGTHGTVAGSWNLNDGTSARIMESFYRNLLKGMGVSESLRQAKLSQLKAAGSSEYSLPYFWNSLVYIGIDQQVIPEKPSASALTILLIVALLGTFIVAFVVRRNAVKEVI